MLDKIHVVLNVLHFSCYVMFLIMLRLWLLIEWMCTFFSTTYLHITLLHALMIIGACEDMNFFNLFGTFASSNRSYSIN